VTYLLAFFTALGCIAVVFSFLVVLLYAVEPFLPQRERHDVECWRSEEVTLPSGRRVDLLDRRGCGR
jgi:hypothetical protein